jgi:hypothetical protein
VTYGALVSCACVFTAEGEREGVTSSFVLSTVSCSVPRGH